jgi:hypothetical protein
LTKCLAGVFILLLEYITQKGYLIIFFLGIYFFGREKKRGHASDIVKLIDSQALSLKGGKQMLSPPVMNG